MPQIQINPEHTALSLLALLLGLLAYVLINKIKTKADETTADASAQKTQWEQVQKWMQAQQEENARLHDELKALREEVAELRKEKTESELELHRAQALIMDLTETLVQREKWIADGAVPPPPTMAAHIAARLREQIDQIREAQAGEANGR